MPSVFLAAGDFDPIQIAIVVLFVIGGFIKWVWENWQAKREDDRRGKTVDPEEKRLRDEAWRRQTGQARRATPPPVPAPDTWGELRKAWNELKEAARQSQEPASPPVTSRPVGPPPLRQTRPQPEPPPPRRGSVRATLTAAEAKLAAAAAERAPAAVAPTPAVLSQPATVVEQRPASPFLISLQNLRGNPALMRQAIVMHEVLGPPKALQSSGDAAI